MVLSILFGVFLIGGTAVMAGTAIATYKAGGFDELPQDTHNFCEQVKTLFGKREH